MALQGTLKDFGIADILQLIGQQQKTGVLRLTNREQEVLIHFNDGNIVRAESLSRKKKELIGTMLLRAELISEQQLEVALETQRRTLKRLGDVLVTSGFLSRERFRQMVQLQIHETLYKLFSWKSGNYAFEQGPSEADEDITPLRAESVLMEGFRMVDEWPMVKKTIGRFDLTFEQLKDLPPPQMQEDDLDAAFDDAFAEEKPEENKGEFKTLGSSERAVFELAIPGRDVRKIVDISCLGEFETCKALCNLVNLGYLSIQGPTDRSHEVEGGLLRRMGRAVAHVTLSVVVIGVVGLVVSRVEPDAIHLGKPPTTAYADPAAQRFAARSQVSRLEQAITLYRLETGSLPGRLEELVEAGLVTEKDLRHPWSNPYEYRREGEAAFVLLSPLH